MNKIIYDIAVTLRLGEAIPSIKEFEEILNRHLSEDGFEEKLHVSSKMELGQLKVSRLLTDLEKKQIGAIMHTQFMKLPKIGTSISGVELTLCESHKSSSQSYNATNETNAQ